MPGFLGPGLNAFHFLVQVFAVVHLNKAQNLHSHVRLVPNSPFKRKEPPVPCLRIRTRQVYVHYVWQPVSVLGVQLFVEPAIEDLLTKTVYFSASLFPGVKKAAFE